MPNVGPEVARSIVGIIFLVLGAVTLIALALPGQGALTDWWRDSIAPWFGTGRWLLPFLLLGAGAYLEVGPGKRPDSGWGATLVGVAIAFVGFLGAFEVLHLNFLGTERGGGRIGRFLASVLEPLLTSPGAFVVCVAILAIGLMLAFNLQFKELLQPLGRSVGPRSAAATRSDGGGVLPARRGQSRRRRDHGAGGRSPPRQLEPARGRDGAEHPRRARADRRDRPRSSQTVCVGRRRRPVDAGRPVGRRRRRSAARPRLDADRRADRPRDRSRRSTGPCRPIELLDPRPAAAHRRRPIDHEANIQRIEEKLLSFAIPAKVVGHELRARS